MHHVTLVRLFILQYFISATNWFPLIITVLIRLCAVCLPRQININAAMSQKFVASLQVLLGFVILKLNVETVLDSNFHLYGGVEFRVGAQCVDHDVQLFADVI